MKAVYWTKSHTWLGEFLQAARIYNSPSPSFL